MTCDVCELDIGAADERRPKAHFEVSRVPNPGGIEKQDPRVYICSAACLRAFAATTPEPDRRGAAPSRRGRSAA